MQESTYTGLLFVTNETNPFDDKMYQKKVFYHIRNRKNFSNHSFDSTWPVNNHRYIGKISNSLSQSTMNHLGGYLFDSELDNRGWIQKVEEHLEAENILTKGPNPNFNVKELQNIPENHSCLFEVELNANLLYQTNSYSNSFFDWVNKFF